MASRQGSSHISRCPRRQGSSGLRHRQGHSLGLLFLSGNSKACQMLSVPEKENMGRFQITRELHSGGSATAKSARATTSKNSWGQPCSNTASSQSVETQNAKPAAATNHRPLTREERAHTSLCPPTQFCYFASPSKAREKVT